MNYPLGDSIYFRFMDSLDAAFLARQGLEGCSEDDWGERFFALLAEEPEPWAEQRTVIYAAASRLLYQFALRLRMEDVADAFYRNPGPFLRTIIAMIQNGFLP